MNVTLKWLFEAFKGGLVLELSFYLCIIFLSVLLVKSFCNPLINSHTFFLVFQKLQKRTNIYIVDSTHIILCSVVIVKFPCLLVLFVPSFLFSRTVVSTISGDEIFDSMFFKISHLSLILMLLKWLYTSFFSLFSRMPAIGCKFTGWSTATAASSTWMMYSATWPTTKTGWVRYERWRKY